MACLRGGARVLADGSLVSRDYRFKSNEPNSPSNVVAMAWWLFGSRNAAGNLQWNRLADSRLGLRPLVQETIQVPQSLPRADSNLVRGHGIAASTLADYQLDSSALDVRWNRVDGKNL